MYQQTKRRLFNLKFLFSRAYKNNTAKTLDNRRKDVKNKRLINLYNIH